MSLTVVSVRSARPSLKYCLTFECLYWTWIAGSTPRLMTRVWKRPGVVAIQDEHSVSPADLRQIPGEVVLQLGDLHPGHVAMLARSVNPVNLSGACSKIASAVLPRDQPAPPTPDYSFNPDSAIPRTKARWLVWAELDANPKDPANVYVYISGSAPPRSPKELAGCTISAKNTDPNSPLMRCHWASASGVACGARAAATGPGRASAHWAP